VTRRLGVLISGRGSNLQAILAAIDRGDLDAEVAVVISSRPDAPGLIHARDGGVATEVVEHRGLRSRAEYDAALVERLRHHRVGLVCLAGFMRILGPVFVNAFPQAILNVHPSLLPAFPGVEAQRQALEHGVKIAGCTVHLVTEGLDEGPIVAQAAVPVLEDDTRESLAARILVEEHRLYPSAIAQVLAGGWQIDGRRFLRQARPGRRTEARS
jgi:phosphoribosylglycinamide formyltransferase-1